MSCGFGGWAVPLLIEIRQANPMVLHRYDPIVAFRTLGIPFPVFAVP